MVNLCFCVRFSLTNTSTQDTSTKYSFHVSRLKHFIQYRTTKTLAARGECRHKAENRTHEQDKRSFSLFVCLLHMLRSSHSLTVEQSCLEVQYSLFSRNCSITRVTSRRPPSPLFVFGLVFQPKFNVHTRSCNHLQSVIVSPRFKIIATRVFNRVSSLNKKLPQ